MSLRNIDILVIDDCPNADVCVERARDAITAVSGGATLRIIEVASDDEAVAMRFLGSPTVRVDGRDVERGAEARTEFGYQCRIYAVEGRLDVAPPSEWIRAALLRNDDHALAPSGDTATDDGCSCGAHVGSRPHVR